ncbi:MAG: acetyl-CoA carboxylase carboxyltransferase subunit alpha [Phycisphaerales bacterium]|nr:acetyl-CoA carboxylase carboxyltransferase subunit alpha [Phycisphaerales bacterium]
MSAPSASDAGVGFKNLLEFEKPIAKMEQEIQRLEASQAETGRDYSEAVRAIREQLTKTLVQAYSNLTPWETVQVARHPKRPLLRDYIRMLCKDFCELHGDRFYGDDHALVCGFARLGGQRVMLLGHQKGRETKERIEVNFGCAHPEGYRKAMRCMRLAEKFGVPVVALVDTPGAFPGVESEERGIAYAIAYNLMEMSRLRTPVIACVIGEGGSGGALGIAVADQVAVMEHAYYSVISPEGCAAILWKSGEHAARAANALKLTPRELKRLNLIDSIIEEPLGGAHRDPAAAAASVEAWIVRSLKELKRVRLDTLLKRRYEKLRNLGSFFETLGEPPAAEQKVVKQRSKKAAAVAPAVASATIAGA